MGGSVSRYPDGQLAMRAIDNGAGHACSESFEIRSFSFYLYLFFKVLLQGVVLLTL